VYGSVDVEHGLGRGLGDAMAFHASGLRADGVGDVKLTTAVRIALADGGRILGVLAEVLDDADLPIGGAVMKIGGIEGGFLVGVIRIFGVQTGEGGGGAKGGHGLCDEADAVLGVLDQDGGEILGGVVADGFGAGHHQLSFGEDLAPGVAGKEVIREMGREEAGDTEDDEEDEVNFAQELHGVVSSLNFKVYGSLRARAIIAPGGCGRRVRSGHLGAGALRRVVFGANDCHELAEVL
jgi:hypothetical protein